MNFWNCRNNKKKLDFWSHQNYKKLSFWDYRNCEKIGFLELPKLQKNWIFEITETIKNWSFGITEITKKKIIFAITEISKQKLIFWNYRNYKKIDSLTKITTKNEFFWITKSKKKSIFSNYRNWNKKWTFFVVKEKPLSWLYTFPYQEAVIVCPKKIILPPARFDSFVEKKQIILEKTMKKWIRKKRKIPFFRNSKRKK